LWWGDYGGVLEHDQRQGTKGDLATGRMPNAYAEPIYLYAYWRILAPSLHRLMLLQCLIIIEQPNRDHFAGIDLTSRKLKHFSSFYI
jgi:hypothetical protein